MTDVMQQEYVNLLQIANVLSEKYGFSERVIHDFAEYVNEEIWLFNYDDPHFQCIRVTSRPESLFKDEDKRRIDLLLKFIELERKKTLSFLDIHTGRNEHKEEEESYPSLYLHFNGYHDGYDVNAFYPEIYHCIEYFEDEDATKMISALTEKFMKQDKKRRKVLPLHKKIPYPITLTIIILCCLVYLVYAILARKYADSAVYVFLGADYKTFTLGLRQFYRLLTCGFVHGSLLHLLSNMYSLYIVGSYLETRLGKARYLFALFVSMLVASLSQGILSSNTITIGMSGGIYGLMMIFLLDLIHLKLINPQSLVPLVLINLFINFLGTTAVIAHLGGLVTGVVLYFVYFTKDKAGTIFLLAVLLLSLIYRYGRINLIEPIYAGTDMEVVRINYDLGFKDYSLQLSKRLSEVYLRYGGLK